VSGLTAFVTGANGFVGSHLVRALIGHGHTVRALVRPNADRSRVHDLPLEWVTGDLDDHAALEQGCQGAQWIIHVAGRTKAPDFESYRHANATGTANVLAAALKAGPQLERFVYVSSLAVGGPSTNGHPRQETDPEAPITPYGQSKLEGEKLVRDHADRLPITVIRPPAVYGPGDTMTLPLFQAVKWHLKPIFGSQPARVTMVHINDLVDGLYLAAAAKEAVGEVFYIAETTEYDLSEVWNIIQAALDTWAVRVPIPRPALISLATVCEWAGKVGGFTPKLNRAKARDLLQKDWTCSSAKAARLLGYESRVPFARGARQTIEWYRAMGWL
jgi:dihydroflavonol-4-reductase